MTDLKSYIRTIPDFPEKGIMFRDVTTLFGHPDGMQQTTDQLYEAFKDDGIEMVAGIEARGFILGGALACRFGAGFIPVRKKGKLPHQTLEESYTLEYGEATLEVHLDAIVPGQRVLIVDDLIATGGTAGAAISLITRLGGQVAGCGFVVDLPDLGGADKVRARCSKVVSLITFQGH